MQRVNAQLPPPPGFDRRKRLWLAVAGGSAVVGVGRQKTSYKPELRQRKCGGSRRISRLEKRGETVGESDGGVARKRRCGLARTVMSTKFLQLGWRQNIM